MRSASCARRIHKWNTGKGAPGSFCLDCQKSWQPPGRLQTNNNGAWPSVTGTGSPAPQEGVPTSAPVPNETGTGRAGGLFVSEAAASKLAAALGGAGAPAQAHVAPAGTTAEAEAAAAPTSNGLIRRAAKHGPKAFVNTLAYLYKEFGDRQAAKPDEDDFEEFQQDFENALRVWFPDVALSPTKALLFSGSMLAGSMWANGKPIKKEEPPPATNQGTSPPARVADSDSTRTPATHQPTTLSVL